jgi:4-amino-4-deoxy-L-arabinose transferase-like glycosyltransferase
MKTKITLIFILILGVFLRLYHLSYYPPLNPDEAAIAYNDFSLIKTGIDEHGFSWPVHFTSFGDYKPGGYFYLALPFIYLLGPSILAVRLPNFILSILALIFFFKLIKTLSHNSLLAISCLFVLSISPWHLHFSRGAWESNAALSLVIIGTYFFYHFLNTKKTRFFLSFVILFAISLYTYHSARIFAPLLALFLLIFNHRSLAKDLPRLIPSILSGFLICLPLLFSLINGGALTRLSGVGLTSDTGPVWRSNELLNHHQAATPDFLVFRLLHNYRISYLISWGQKYLSHYDLNFLFLNGDEVPRSRVPFMGQNYLFELPLLILGILFLLKSDHKKLALLVFFWLLISPLASSLTFQAPSALRSLPEVIPLSIFIGLGFYRLLIWLKSQTTNLRLPVYFFLSLTIVYSLGYYLNSYFVLYQKMFPSSWGYGFDKAISYLNQHKSGYSSVYFTNKYDQPYILYLFYSQFSPQLLHPQIRLTSPDNFGFSTVNQIDNIHFQSINWDDIPVNSLIFASNSDNIPSSINPLTLIDFPNGQPAFKIYQK